MKKVKIRDTDDPWITNHIRNKIETRKKIFKRGRRGDEWKEARKETTKLIKESKKEWYDKYKEQAKTSNDPALYYKVVNRLKDKESPRVSKSSHYFLSKRTKI